MADEATTSDAADSQAQATTDENPVDNTAELEKAASTEAVESSEETSQTSETDQTGSEEDASEEASTEGNPDEEAEIREWAAKKNLPLDEPLKLAKMYRESEKALGRRGDEQGQLKKAVTEAGNETGVDDTDALRNEVAALTFKIEHPEAAALEPTMVSILEQRPWMAGDLDGVLLMAKGMQPQATEAEIAAANRQAGSKEALAAAANAERAAAPRASQSTRETPSPYMSDEDAGKLSPAEYQQAKADGKIKPW